MLLQLKKQSLGNTWGNVNSGPIHQVESRISAELACFPKRTFYLIKNSSKRKAIPQADIRILRNNVYVWPSTACVNSLFHLNWPRRDSLLVFYLLWSVQYICKYTVLVPVSVFLLFSCQKKRLWFAFCASVCHFCLCPIYNQNLK